MSPQPPKVLLVDDEEGFTETLAKLLGRRGYEVQTAPNAAQALRFVLRGGVKVVILDLKMPGLSGMDALREIKRLAPAIEVIILTGHLRKSSEHEGLSLGAFAYLTKPCTVAQLIQAIEGALAKQAAGGDGGQG